MTSIDTQVDVVNEHNANNDNFDGLGTALSAERIGRYIDAANGDIKRAYELYAVNAQVSNAMYILLHMLEICLRNGFHFALTTKYGHDWFDQVGVIKTISQRQKISEAKLRLVSDRKPIEPGRLVASLTFGFWTTCIGSEYNEDLWIQAIHRPFKKNQSLTRKKLNRDLTPLRNLRNRIAHHEPILSWNLLKHYENGMIIIQALSPDAHQWVKENCKFHDIYDESIRKEFK
ncbi:hypothetical protein [Ochrobactrum sp. S1502_03]|uniref:hypothetical protein n=1 Tax=Ochrobactrum sp. S1502_03 TaxID=3108451 RepID=UPI0037C579F9